MGLEAREGPDRAETGLVGRGESSCLQVASEVLITKGGGSSEFSRGGTFPEVIT